MLLPPEAPPARVFRLLYVEDNPGDVLMMQEALRDLSIKIDLAVVNDGEKALCYLRQESPYEKALRPHLVLLDLNLPRVSGEAVLTTVKSDCHLKRIPVVVFTSVASEELCKPIYSENANSCVRKPGNLDEFFGAVRQLCEYWFSIANVPET